jgi:hypothetical protein
MNYTYVAAGDAEPYESEPVIILATTKNTQKFDNISSNSKVSVLVHDWVTARSLGQESGSGGGLSQFLHNLNQSELSSVSATLSGCATIVEGGEKEKFFRDKHLKAHSREARCFIEGAVIVLVKVQSATVADSHNRVSTYENLN